MPLAILPLLLLGVLLNASAQLLLKAGMDKIGHFAFSWSSLWQLAPQVASNVFILLGLSAYVISVVVWLLVLSRIDVSIAYPMVSIGYIVNAVAAYYLLGENLSFTRVLGIVIILLGVVLVSRS